jgi:hypothetical protein
MEKTVLVTWCYDDEDILEAGKDFEHMVSIPFQFKEVHSTGVLAKTNH